MTHTYECQHFNQSSGYGTPYGEWLVRRHEVRAGHRELARVMAAASFGWPLDEVIVRYVSSSTVHEDGRVLRRGHVPLRPMKAATVSPFVRTVPDLEQKRGLL